MNNPLYYNSKATGVKAAYEQAAFMDDTEDKLNRVQFVPRQKSNLPTPTATAGETTITKTKPTDGEIVGTAFGACAMLVVLPIAWLLNPLIGAAATLCFAASIKKKGK